MAKSDTHATGRYYRRTRRNKAETLDRAEKQAARRARVADVPVVWDDAPAVCPTCGRGLSDVYRREPHYRRLRRSLRVRGARPVWCPGGPFVAEVNQ